MENQYSRRRFLKTAGASALASVLGGLGYLAYDSNAKYKESEEKAKKLEGELSRVKSENEILDDVVTVQSPLERECTIEDFYTIMRRRVSAPFKTEQSKKFEDYWNTLTKEQKQGHFKLGFYGYEGYKRFYSPSQRNELDELVEKITPEQIAETKKAGYFWLPEQATTASKQDKTFVILHMLSNIDINFRIL